MQQKFADEIPFYVQHFIYLNPKQYKTTMYQHTLKPNDTLENGKYRIIRIVIVGFNHPSIMPVFDVFE